MSTQVKIEEKDLTTPQIQTENLTEAEQAEVEKVFTEAKDFRTV